MVGRAAAVLANQRGLTLIETVLALAILAIGIVGVLHAFSLSMVSMKEAEAYSTAAILADQVASGLDRQASLDSGELSGTFEEESNYSWTASIEPEDANGMVRASISVIWGLKESPRHFDMVVCLHNTSAGSTTAPGSSSNPSPGGN